MTVINLISMKPQATRLKLAMREMRDALAELAELPMPDAAIQTTLAAGADPSGYLSPQARAQMPGDDWATIGLDMRKTLLLEVFMQAEIWAVRHPAEQ